MGEGPLFGRSSRPLLLFWGTHFAFGCCKSVPKRFTLCFQAPHGCSLICICVKACHNVALRRVSTKRYSLVTRCFSHLFCSFRHPFGALCSGVAVAKIRRIIDAANDHGSNFLGKLFLIRGYSLCSQVCRLFFSVLL